MSSFNVQPPQTYSRLFRPWDCNTRATPVNQTIATVQNSASEHLVKSEIVSSTQNMPAATAPLVKTEQFSFGGNESDRECASSGSSCSKSSTCENSYNNSMLMESPPTSPSMANNFVRPVPYTNIPLAPHTQLSTHATGMTYLMPSMPAATASNLYYAAAAAAAANGLPPVPTASSSSAAAAAAATYALDPYSLSLMEQEYARVMAEDAHLKAVNARKQRPKKFKCPRCDVAFSNNGQLKGHIRIHTGERPFKCDVETCLKTFTRNEELTRHKRIHTGLRPYPCNTCGKRFGRRDHLKKHMKTHMPQERQLEAAFFMPMYPYIYSY